MVEIYNTPLNHQEILNKWFLTNSSNKYGAFVSFVGVIRDENSIDGLSFDIFEPVLENWFKEWQNIAEKNSSKIFMAHSKGDVLVGENSFVCAILSPKRRFSLETLDKFVEDFKHNAPIWKYDLINSKRVYALERSQKIDGSGILLKASK